MTISYRWGPVPGGVYERYPRAVEEWVQDVTPKICQCNAVSSCHCKTGGQGSSNSNASDAQLFCPPPSPSIAFQLRAEAEIIILVTNTERDATVTFVLAFQSCHNGQKSYDEHQLKGKYHSLLLKRLYSSYLLRDYDDFCLCWTK